MNLDLMEFILETICLKVVNLDEYADVEVHWIAMFQVMMLLILIVLKLNMFLKKLSILLEIKICKQTYLEYKQIIQ